MSNTVVLIVVIAAVAVAVLAGIALRRRRTTAGEAPVAAIQLGALVGGFVEAAHRCASEADPAYVAAFARLRGDPESAAHQIETAYRSLSGEQLRMRESLLLAAVALAHPSILPLLVDVAQQPVEGSVRHDGGRAAEESIVRMMAVDGIEAITRTGDGNAALALVALAASPDRATQAAAVVALKYAEGHGALFERARDALPPERRFLADVVRAHARDVPQVSDPRRHLRTPATTADTRPDLATGERRNGGTAPLRGRVPRARTGR